MSDELRLEKLYRAGQSTYKASIQLRISSRFLDRVGEEELAEEASRLEREVKQLHREIDDIVGGQQ